MYKIAVILFENDNLPNFPEVCTSWDDHAVSMDLFLFGQSRCTVAAPACVEKVWRFDCDDLQTWDMTPYAAALETHLKAGGYDLIAMNAAHCTTALAPLLAQRLGSDCLPDISSFSFEEEGVSAQKLLFSMNLTGQYRLRSPCPVVTIIDSGTMDEAAFVPVKQLSLLPAPQPPAAWFSHLTRETLPETESFGTKKRLIAAGRGLDAAQYEKAGQLAALLDAELGTTRALVQQGIAPIRSLIGISGTLVRPEKCLILGASGAAPFAIGVEKSTTIFGVNIEPMAPLFSFCDYGLVCDAGELLEEMLRQVQAEKGAAANEEATEK